MSTLLLRLALISVSLRVMGIVLADVIVTAVLMLVLVRWFAPLIRPVFSTDVLRAALKFGLPRVPHGFALQVMAVADRLILQRFTSLEVVGVYSIGVGFGLVPKIALGAFESAWAPFYYAPSREPDARGCSPFNDLRHSVFVDDRRPRRDRPRSARPDDRRTLYRRRPVVLWIAIGVFFYGIYC